MSKKTSDVQPMVGSMKNPESASKKELTLETSIKVQSSNNKSESKSGNLTRLQRRRTKSRDGSSAVPQQQESETSASGEAKQSSSHHPTAQRSTVRAVPLAQAQHILNQLNIMTRKKDTLLQQNQLMAKANAEQINRYHKLQANYKILYRRCQMLHALYKQSLVANATTATSINPHHKATQTTATENIRGDTSLAGLQDVDISEISGSDSFISGDGALEEYERSREAHEESEKSSSREFTEENSSASSSTATEEKSSERTPDSFLFSTRTDPSSSSDQQEQEDTNKDEIIRSAEAENAKLKHIVHEVQSECEALEEQLEEAQSTIAYLKDTFTRHLLDLKAQIQTD